MGRKLLNKMLNKSIDIIFIRALIIMMTSAVAHKGHLSAGTSLGRTAARTVAVFMAYKKFIH